MEVGNYVRTKYGIEKIKIIEKDFLEKGNNFIATDNDLWRGAYNGKYNGFTIRSGIIIKSSPNIIDLIEVGDYVNGERVINIIKKHKYLEVSDEEIIIDEKDIKSIVTKEQFEAIQYEVK